MCYQFPFRTHNNAFFSWKGGAGGWAEVFGQADADGSCLRKVNRIWVVYAVDINWGE